MPEPKVAAVVVMGLLAFGVLLGSVTSQIAQSAGISSILLSVPSTATTTEPSAPPATAVASAPVAAPAAPAPAAAPASAPLQNPGPSTDSTPPSSGPGDVPPDPLLPPVKHVFLIVLGEQGFDQTFGPTSSDTYLSKTLAGQGELLANYYGVASGSLANEIALISGQGPNPQTAANCPTFTDFAPDTLGEEGQATGSGCVYPTDVTTVADQLATAGKQWKAYVEDIGSGAGQATTCRHPALSVADSNQAPLPGDAYETWRNPFVYFHSLIDSPACDQSDVGLDQLAPDLQSADTAPSLSYIVPNACHDGSEQPCAPGQQAGPAGADAFLQTVIPEIQASPAYEDGGLIAITFAQAPQTGPNADSSACCVAPQYPNLPAPATPVVSNGPIKPSGGGGHVGMLLISPFVKAGSVNDTAYFNHFSMLLTIETLFGLQPLGYASDPGALGFDSTIFNAFVQES